MNLTEFIERIMTEHWDMVRCYCPICTVGRENGLAARERYLGRDEKDAGVLAVAHAMAPHLDGVKRDISSRPQGK